MKTRDENHNIIDPYYPDGVPIDPGHDPEAERQAAETIEAVREAYAEAYGIKRTQTILQQRDELADALAFAALQSDNDGIFLCLCARPNRKFGYPEGRYRPENHTTACQQGIAALRKVGHS